MKGRYVVGSWVNSDDARKLKRKLLKYKIRHQEYISIDKDRGPGQKMEPWICFQFVDVRNELFDLFLGEERENEKEKVMEFMRKMKYELGDEYYWNFPIMKNESE